MKNDPFLTVKYHYTYIIVILVYQHLNVVASGDVANFNYFMLLAHLIYNSAIYNNTFILRRLKFYI